MPAGRRWEVTGQCDYRGDCIIGSVIDVNGTPTVIVDHAHIAELTTLLGTTRLQSEMDVPVTPEFHTCCGSDIFTYNEL